MALVVKNITTGTWRDPRSGFSLLPGQEADVEASPYDLRDFEQSIKVHSLKVLEDDTGIMTHLARVPVT